MTGHTLGIIIFLVYLVILVALTYYSNKQVTNSADFATGGGRISPIMLGICLAATVHSAGTFVGVGGLGYAFGFNTLWHALTIPLPVVFSLIIYSKMAHQMANVHQSISMPDWVGHRYQSDAVRVAMAICTMFLIITVFAQYSGAATGFEALLGIPYSWGLVLAVVIVTVYTIFGGAFADVYTDTLQGIMMLIVAIAVAISAVWMFQGGLAEVSSTLQTMDPNLTAVINPTSPLFGSSIYIVIMILVYLTHISEPQNFNKILGVGNKADLRKFIIAMTVFMIGMGLADFGGIYMRALSSSITMPEGFRPDQANFFYIQQAFPPLFAALFQVAIVAAVMSTMDGLLVSLGVGVSNDIYRRVMVPRGWGGIKPDAPQEEIERRTVMLSRVTVLVIGILTIFAVMAPPDLMAVLMLAGRGALGAAAAGPVVLGLFWKRGNAPGALAAIITGAISFVLIYFIFHLEQNPTAAQFYSTVLAIGAMVIVSLLTKPLAEEHVNAMFKNAAER